MQSSRPGVAVPTKRALIRNLRMLNRHLWELRGEVSMVCDQITIERAESARGQGARMIMSRINRGVKDGE